MSGTAARGVEVLRERVGLVERFRSMYGRGVREKTLKPNKTEPREVVLVGRPRGGGAGETRGLKTDRQALPKGLKRRGTDLGYPS